jgi:hypothetical protein
VGKSIEGTQVSAKNKKEKAAERAKYNDKLNNKSRETNEAKPDCCSNLFKCFLEAGIKSSCY